MSDEREMPSDSGAAKSAAVGVAMNEASRDPGVAADVREFLREQTVVLRLQAEDLRREDRLRHWSLRVHHISDVLKLGFELAAAAVVTAIVVFIGAAVWSAAHDDGLVIEAFAVPADMAANGLSGQVVATQVQDRLAWMQDHTDTIRQANSY